MFNQVRHCQTKVLTNQIVACIANKNT
ncbi:hypothetical protein VCCP1040_2969, partial [Vibrio cholerae CP1040(13)]